MKRDRFEKELHKKLYDLRQEPPQELWARIERSLAEGAGAPAGVVVRPPSRRVLPRRVFWQYAVAAVLALVVLNVALFTLRNNDIVPAAPQTIAVAPPVSTPESQAVAGPAVTAEVVATSRPAKLAVAVAVPEATAPKAMQRSQPVTKESRQEIHTEQSAPSAFRQRPYTAPRTQYAGVPADDFRPARKRAGGVSASLFALNSGVLKGESMRSNTYAASDLRVVELQTGGMGNEYSSYGRNELTHRFPLTFGVSVAGHIAPAVSLESGVTYSYLFSEAEATTTFRYRTTQDLHYVGIPLSVNCYLAQGRLLAFYVRGGGAAEIGVSGRRRYITETTDGSSSSVDTYKIKMGNVQFSAGAGVGGELRLGKVVGLYAEPGVSYYFRNGKQPESYYTENPLTFTVKAGIRFAIN